MRLSRFICRDEEERAWLLDMHTRMEPVERRATLIVGVALVACLPWFPLLAAVPMVVAGVLFFAGSLAVSRTGRLEPLLAGWFAATALIMAAAVLAALDRPFDGATLAVGSTLLVWPLLGACGALPGRVVAVCAAWCGVLVLGAFAVWFGPEARAYPPMVAVPVAMLLATATISSAVRRASLEHRTAAVIDRLTGMLNRTALETRASELRHQSELTGERVGLLVVDLDHFKQINDTHGHAAGDRVLEEVAYRLRKQLRAFDLAYRVGGEEFIVLLPGADLAQAQSMADALWSAVRSAAIAGLEVTASIGVAVSDAGSPFDYDATFRAADAALYRAKEEGRDRVCLAGDPVTLRPAA